MHGAQVCRLRVFTWLSVVGCSNVIASHDLQRRALVALYPRPKLLRPRKSIFQYFRRDRAVCVAAATYLARRSANTVQH